MTGKIKVFGISDPLTQPSGFGRVARELFAQLPKDRFECGFLSRGWVGTGVFPGVQTYSTDTGDIVCSRNFWMAAEDFKPPFILWTLMDPWQTGWLSHPAKNAYSDKYTAQWLEANRGQIRWVGHYPVDGEGYRDGPPFWYEDFLNGPDVTVFMSQFGQRTLAPLMTTRYTVISHAVNLGQFNSSHWLTDPTGEKRAEFKRAHKVDGRHVVLTVMANRRRKLWPELLKGFALALQKEPDLHLIAVCGDVSGSDDGTWSIEGMAHTLGLLGTKEHPEKARITFVATVSEQGLTTLYALADQFVLLSTGEGFGLPQLEAHACGLPCTVGRYSASEELILDPNEGISPRGFTYEGNNVIKRPVYSPHDVADAILFWRRNEDRRKAMVPLGFRQASERSWEKVLPQWVTLFEGLWAEITPKEEVPDGAALPLPGDS